VYKSILATASVFAVAGSAFLAAPAFADDLPTASDPGTPVSTSINDNAPDGDGGATIQTTDGQSYKADFDWNVPDNPNGAPYTTCDVSLFRDNGELAFSAPYPASQSKLTLQFGATELTGSPIVPGTTGLTIHYTCTNGTDTSAEQTLDSIAVPDVVPTKPTTANIAADGTDGLNIQYGGSKAIGVAQVEGYQVQIFSFGSPYLSVSYDDSGHRINGNSGPIRGFSRMGANALQGINGDFDNLPPGVYTIKVSGFNSIGLSDAKASTTEVVINGKAPATVRKANPNNLRGVATLAKADSAKITWKAPVSDAAHADVSRYVVSVSLNGKTVQSKTVAASTTSLTVNKLKAGTNYRVLVEAYGLNNASVHSSITFKTPKAAKAVKAPKAKKVVEKAKAAKAKAAKAKSVKGKKVVKTKRH
jgi:hypothetical protein